MTALMAVQSAIESSISTDKGHRSSTGTTVIEFWLQQPGNYAAESPTSFAAEMSSSINATDITPHSQGEPAEDEPSKEYDDELDKVLSAMDEATCKLDEMTAITKALELSVAELDKLVQKTPDDQVSAKTRRALDNLHVGWAHFTSKPMGERTEKQGKALMMQFMQVMQIRKEARSELMLAEQELPGPPSTNSATGSHVEGTSSTSSPATVKPNAIRATQLLASPNAHNSKRRKKDKRSLAAGLTRGSDGKHKTT